MSAAPAIVSIGDKGILNRELPSTLSEVWIDRDLGWLDFNDRVLAQALDERTPLLERAKFLAIFTSNLDEFFMKRVSLLRSAAAPERVNLLEQVRERVVESLELQAACFRDAIVPGLARHGIHLRKWDDLTAAQQEEPAATSIPRSRPLSRRWFSIRLIRFRFCRICRCRSRSCCAIHEKETTSYARVKVPPVLSNGSR